MDNFLNANNFRNNDLESKSLKNSDHHVLLLIFSLIRFSQIFVSKVILILKIVHHYVVDILVTSESSPSIA